MCQNKNDLLLLLFLYIGKKPERILSNKMSALIVIITRVLKIIGNLHNDVVDGYVNEFDEEPNETHYAEADGRGDSDFLEFCAGTKD